MEVDDDPHGRCPADHPKRSRLDTDHPKRIRLSTDCEGVGTRGRQSIGREDLGEHELGGEDLGGSVLDGRRLGGSHEDLLSCLVCSGVQVSLRVEGRQGVDARLVAALADAGLETLEPGARLGARLGSWLLVGRGPPDTPLHGALVHVDILASTACRLRLYLR